LSLGLVSLVILALYFFASGRLHSNNSTQEASIAVLPFINLSSNLEDEYFSDGMMLEILDYLSHIPDLKITSRTTAMHYKGSNKTLQEIGKELGVQKILEGSVRKSENKVRISVQLIDVNTDQSLWSDSYDRNLDDVFAIQRDVAKQVAFFLGSKFRQELIERIKNKPTDNMEAYDLYLKGVYYREHFTLEEINYGHKCLEQAVQLDPNFANAYAQLSHTYTVLSYGLAPSNEVIPKAIDYSKKALEIDSNNYTAYMNLGNISINYSWDWSAAERYYKKAIQLNPNEGGSFSNYSVLLTYTGNFHAAIASALKAQKIDPFSAWVNHSVGFAYYHARDYDKAIDAFRNTVRMYPDFIGSRFYLGQALRAKSLHKEAILVHEELFNHTGGDIRTMAILTNTYYELGKEESADALFDELTIKSQSEYVSPSLLYLIHKSRGENDLAFNAFEKAVKERDTWLLWVIVDPIEGELIPKGQRYETFVRNGRLRRP
jgi:TolB-like protein/Tfp pilus assembly protein PilF